MIFRAPLSAAAALLLVSCQAARLDFGRPPIGAPLTSLAGAERVAEFCADLWWDCTYRLGDLQVVVYRGRVQQKIYTFTDGAGAAPFGLTGTETREQIAARFCRDGYVCQSGEGLLEVGLENDFRALVFYFDEDGALERVRSTVYDN